MHTALGLDAMSLAIFFGNCCDHNTEHAVHHALTSLSAQCANELQLSAVCHATTPLLQDSKIMFNCSSMRRRATAFKLAYFVPNLLVSMIATSGEIECCLRGLNLTIFMNGGSRIDMDSSKAVNPADGQTSIRSSGRVERVSLKG